jgi:hypothetical protein
LHTFVSDDNIIFNKSYNGYSARKHPNGKRLVRYLALIIGSKVALWHALIASGKFGVERDVVEKLTVDGLPIPDFDSLKPSDINKIDKLYNDVIENDNELTWDQIDKWVAELYGLRKKDLQVIADTLKFNLPFSKNIKIAQYRPDEQEVESFCRILTSEIKPWAKRSGKSVNVNRVSLSEKSPWGFLRIDFQEASTSQANDTDPVDWAEVIRIADQMAATEIIHPDNEKNCLWVGRLNQARYWSQSQARLVARRIIWDHVEMLAERSTG